MTTLAAAPGRPEVRLLHRAAILLCALAGPFACGTPDSQVFGGIIGDANTPNAIINDVGSAIAGVVTLTDSNGNSKQFDAFILTDRKNLCASVTARRRHLRS